MTNINNRDIRPDAQGFDEVRLVTVPRYKTSGLSGDEWRISVIAEYYRKGRLITSEFIAHKMETAVNFLGYKYVVASENHPGAYFGGEGDFCDQEGCSKIATWTAVKKFDWSRDGHKSEKPSKSYRLFCDQHKIRGDCGLDDSDSNYEFIEHRPEFKGNAEREGL